MKTLPELGVGQKMEDVIAVVIPPLQHEVLEAHKKKDVWPK